MCAAIPSETFRRHGWVWLAADWRVHLGESLPEPDLALIAKWCGKDRPLVVARQEPGQKFLRLGLALPGRKRVGLMLDPIAVRRSEPPLALERALFAAPAPWRAGMFWLMSEAEKLTVAVALFGSLAWQSWCPAAEMTYLTASSDLDLLLLPSANDRIPALLECLSAGAVRFAQPHWDGEILLEDGGAVAWRECLAGSDRLLVKYPSEIKLLARAGLFGSQPC